MKKKKKIRKKTPIRQPVDIKMVAKLADQGFPSRYIAHVLDCDIKLIYNIRHNNAECKNEMARLAKDHKERSKAICDALVRLVYRQANFGVKEVSKTYDENGRMVSKTVRKKPLSVRELMDMQKIAGLYEPSLTIIQSANKTEDEDTRIKKINDQLKVASKG